MTLGTGPELEQEVRKLKTIFDLLHDIHQRPSMFLAGDEHRRDQLAHLQFLIFGYGHALDAHGIHEPGEDFLRAFAEYLRKTRGTRTWSMSCGPIAAVIEHSQDGEEAWEKFWRLVWKFQQDCFPDTVTSPAFDKERR